MRKFLIPLAIGMFGFTQAIAQEVSEKDQAFETLLNQYATITLGKHINDRCKQLHPKAGDLFNANQKIIDDFMKTILTPEAYQQLSTGVAEAGLDDVANPCGPFTFDFIQAGAQIASTMAYRVQILNGEEEPEPVTTTPVVVQPAEEPAAQPAEELPAEELPAAELPAEEIPAVEVTPDPDPEAQEPDPDPVQEPVQEPEPEPEPAPVEVKLQPTTSGPAAGETKKEMNNRQREESLALRRKQREEVDYYKDNMGDYPDPKAAKKAMDDRHDEEMDAMRQRHYAEDQAEKNK